MMKSLLALSVFALSLVNAQVSLGTTVSLGQFSYFVLPNASAMAYVANGTAPSAWTTSLFPLTLIASNSSSATGSSVQANLSSFASDDVWTTSFQSTVVLRNSGNSTASFDPSLSGVATAAIGYSGAPLSLNISSALPSGPYMATYINNRLDIYRIMRLYPDTNGAFFEGVYQSDSGNWVALPASLPGYNGAAAIGVFSRIYYSADTRPLAGIRISLKDLYDLDGLKTSMGNRAWLNLYPAATTTAPAIQRLLDLGAVVVGKTRLSQFANGQYGTADNVDYLTPFNARGEGYQDPSSSSSGAGAASGAYGWIDMDIGSDTGGSIRAPAAVNGAFGNRPSQGAIDLTGALPLSPAMDTAAFISEGAVKFASLARAWYGGNSTLTANRLGSTNITTLLYLTDPPAGAYNNTPSPGFFPSSNNLSAPIYESFVSKVEGLLNVKRTVTDYYALVNSSLGAIPPDFVGPAWSLLTAYDQWTTVGTKFYSDYGAAHGGDVPFTDASLSPLSIYGKNISAEERSFWFERKLQFENFVTTTNLPNCSTLQIFPLVTGLPFYKSDYHEASPVYNGSNRYTISQLGGVPEVVLPIGQVPYLSKISNTTKYLPVSISIQSAQTCDFVLYDLIERLANNGILNSTTISGPNTFPL